MTAPASNGSAAAAPATAPVITNLDGKRILIVRFSGLGDVVLTLPAVAALRRAYPKAHIAWLAADGPAAILRHCPVVDEVIPLKLTSSTDRRSNLFRRFRAARRFAKEYTRMFWQLRAEPFDAVIEFQNLLKCGLFTRLNRRAVRIGFKGGGEPTHWFLHHTPVRKDTGSHATLNYLQLAAACGGVTEPVEFPIAVPADAVARMAGALQGAGIAENDRVVLISPFGRRRSKLWGFDRHAEICKRITAETGARPICAPAPSDLDDARRIAELSGGALAVLPDTTLEDLLALLQRADCFFGIDGGPMHLAGALDTPVCALWGPTNRRWIGPWGEIAGALPGTQLPRAVVVQAMELAAHTSRKAKRAAWTDTAAMDAISVDMAWEALVGAYGSLLSG
ncbi:MAG: glycosyltransferase family 9 protein [Planctomycetota bacterium]